MLFNDGHNLLCLCLENGGLSRGVPFLFFRCPLSIHPWEGELGEVLVRRCSLVILRTKEAISTSAAGTHRNISTLGKSKDLAI